MPYKIITLFFDPTTGGFDDEPLNSFLTNKTVRRIEPGFFHHDVHGCTNAAMAWMPRSGDGKAYWSVWVDYDNVLDTTESRQPSIPLTNPEKILLQKLQNWRKERASQRDMAAYIVATNRELEAIVQAKPRTLENLRNIQGFGSKKIKSYGQEIIDMISTFYDKPEAENKPDTTAKTVNESALEIEKPGKQNAG